MKSSRRPPTFIPATPASQPGITWPEPSVNSKADRPACRDESKTVPSVSMPVYCTVSVLPTVAVAPAPVTISRVCMGRLAPAATPAVGDGVVTVPLMVCGWNTVRGVATRSGPARLVTAAGDRTPATETLAIPAGPPGSPWVTRNRSTWPLPSASTAAAKTAAFGRSAAP